MSEKIEYSINGVYFEKYGIYVSRSQGLAGTPPVRSRGTGYQWSEYDGISIDPQESPRYEPRQITLDCFAIGDNWDVLRRNLNALIKELEKPGTVRLLIEPLNFRPLVYDVFLNKEIDVEKRFERGKCAVTFSLNLTEPAPSKVVLELEERSLDLAFIAKKNTRIVFPDGSADEVIEGRVNIRNKPIAPRSIDAPLRGRNLLQNSRTVHSWSQGRPVVIYTGIKMPAGTRVTLSGTGTAGATARLYHGHNSYDNMPELIFNENKLAYKFSTKTLPAQDGAGVPFGSYELILYVNQGDNTPGARIWNIQLETGERTDWKPAPEDRNFILIEARRTDIEDLHTNGTLIE